MCTGDGSARAQSLSGEWWGRDPSLLEARVSFGRRGEGGHEQVLARGRPRDGALTGARTGLLAASQAGAESPLMKGETEVVFKQGTALLRQAASFLLPGTADLGARSHNLGQQRLASAQRCPSRAAPWIHHASLGRGGCFLVPSPWEPSVLAPAPGFGSRGAGNWTWVCTGPCSGPLSTMPVTGEADRLPAAPQTLG